MTTRRQFLNSAAACAATAAAPSLTPAQIVDRPLRLCNGKDLSNFYTFLREKGKNNDPDKVFTVVDGTIRVSGKEFGWFMTEKEYENYLLTFEFKWGSETHPPRKDRARDSGCLFHCVGPDKIWNQSIEYQIIEGGSGDIILVDGASIDWEPESAKRFAGARLSPFGTRVVGGRVNWHRRSPEWKDVVNFRGKDDIERPVGQWNHCQVLCAGDRAVYHLNGVEVNRLTGAEPRKGKILFQSEGAEVFFRRIELQPLRR